METVKTINYPYMPEGREILYVSQDNKYIQAARKFAKEYSLDDTMPTGSVVVKNDKIIGYGANGNDYHKTHECERVKNNIPTGQSYELCEGCHPKNHSETRAIKNAVDSGFNVENADLYLWGHHWCCSACWKSIIDSGICTVYLMEGSEILFDRTKEGNIIGHQFD